MRRRSRKNPLSDLSGSLMRSRSRKTRRNPTSVAQQVEVDLIEDAVLIVIGVGIVGVTGYLIWQAFQNAGKAAAEATVNMGPDPNSTAGLAIGTALAAGQWVDDTAAGVYHSVFGPSTALQQTGQ